jgi:hypothetical protein
MHWRESILKNAQAAQAAPADQPARFLGRPALTGLQEKLLSSQ